jgi:hypothetical protein
MRIVYDFHGKHPCVGGSGHLYGNSIIKSPEWPGFSVSLTICDTDQPRDGGEFREGDCIHWEGDGETIKEALRQAMSIVETVEQFERDRFDKRVANTVQCPQCGCWIERRPDGKLSSHHAVLTEGRPLCPEGAADADHQ